MPAYRRFPGQRGNGPGITVNGGESPPRLSVVLPVYKTGADLPEQLAPLHASLTARFGPVEFVIVDDGTPGGALIDAEALSPVAGRLIRLPRNLGKGAALREGMRSAGGRYRVFTDGDLPYSMASLVTLISELVSGRHVIVIGDRTLPGSTYAEPRTLLRKAGSLVFSTVAQRLVGIRDTQCGLKGFDAAVAGPLFRLCRSRRFAIDLEVLYLARRHGIPIRRVAVHQERFAPSTIRVLPELGRTVVDLMRLAVRARSGRLGDASLLHAATTPDSDMDSGQRPPLAGGMD